MHEMIFRDNASDFIKSMVDLDAKCTLFPRLVVHFFFFLGIKPSLSQKNKQRT